MFNLLIEIIMDFLKYEKGVKESAIKEAKAIIPKIAALCVKKGLDFNLNTGSEVISVFDLNSGFSLDGYYSESLVHYENEQFNTYTVKKVYEKLKTFKTSRL